MQREVVGYFCRKSLLYEKKPKLPFRIANEYILMCIFFYLSQFTHRPEYKNQEQYGSDHCKKIIITTKNGIHSDRKKSPGTRRSAGGVELYRFHA